MAAVLGIPKAWFLEEIVKVQNRAARFVTRNYCSETGNMTGILEQELSEDNTACQTHTFENLNIVLTWTWVPTDATVLTWTLTDADANDWVTT